MTVIAQAESKAADINVEAVKKERRGVAVVVGAIVVGLVGRVVFGAQGAWIY